jgi:hypothetical protein
MGTKTTHRRAQVQLFDSLARPVESVTIKVALFLDTLSVGWDVYLPLCSRKKMPEYGMEGSDIASQNEVQNSTITKVSDNATFFLECTRASSGTLPREEHNSK